jgi:hypothetical protein
MSTFPHPFSRNGAEPMLSSVAEYVSSVEEPDTGDIDVHTITLVLGQHGEFDLTIEATADVDGFLEDRKWTGIAHRSGGVSQFAEVEV